MSTPHGLIPLEASRFRRVATTLLAALLLAASLCRAGEEQAAPKETRFLIGEKCVIPAWLVLRATPEETAAVEKDFAADPAGLTAAGARKWDYANCGDTVLPLAAPAPAGAPKTEAAVYYAYTVLYLQEAKTATLVASATAPCELRVDGQPAVVSAETAAGVQQLASQRQLRRGPNYLLLKVAATDVGTAFAAICGAPAETGLERLAGAECALPLRLPEAQLRAERDRLCAFSTSPRFVDGEERMRFSLQPLAGFPCADGETLRLRMEVRDAAGKVWLQGVSAERSRDEFLASGCEFGLALPGPADWETAKVSGALLAGETALAERQSTIFCEARLKEKLRELKRAAERQDSPSAGLATARLALERTEAETSNRTYRTLKYGERLCELLRQAETGLECDRSGRHPLAGRSGLIEAAYVCETDGSVQPYRIYVPKRLRAEDKAPLVVLLHGYVPSYCKTSWMEIDKGLQTAFEELGWVLLLPFGRSNTDFLSIGEVDVLRAVREAKDNLPVDGERICLAGFSMGGSGVWTLLSHYPGEFAAGLIWSGRADYYYWHEADYAAAGVTRESLPDWKRWLIDADNPYNLRDTLRDIPIKAIHAEDDQLVQFGQTARMYELLKPPAGHMEMVATPPGGAGHWLFAEKLHLPESYLWLADKRNAPAAGVEHVCLTTKYGRKRWAEIELIETWGKPAQIAVTCDMQTQTVRVARLENVARLRLRLNEASFPLAGLPLEPARVKLAPGLERYKVETFGSIGGERGFVVSAPDAPAGGRLKTRNLCGPVKEAFNQPFVLVRGTQGTPEQINRNRENAERFRKEWLEFAKGEPELRADSEVTPELAAAKNLVLFGSPASNTCLAQLADKLPIRWLENGYAIGEKKATGESLGLAAIYPNPNRAGRYVVILDGLFYGDKLPINHKWDLVPDYIVFGKAVDAYDNTNTALVAGLFDSAWTLPPVTHVP